MKTILSCMILSCAAFCISCGSDDPPPPTQTVREVHYYPVKPKTPSGPESFEPVKRF